jgi:hypothetical protein
MKQTKTQALLALAAAAVLLVPSVSAAQEHATSAVSVPKSVASSTATSSVAATTTTAQASTSTPFTIATTTGSESPLWYVQMLDERVQTAATGTIAEGNARTDLHEQLAELRRLLKKAERIEEAGSGASLGFWYSFRANFYENLAVSRLDRFIGNVVIYEERGVISSAVSEAMTAWANTTIDRIRD